MTATGRENRITFYCHRCTWEKTESGDRLSARSGACPTCGERALHFIQWEAGVEDAAARQAIAETRAAPAGPRGPGP